MCGETNRRSFKAISFAEVAFILERRIFKEETGMESLQNARNEIDAIDQEMAKLFERRMKVCRGIRIQARARAADSGFSAGEHCDR